MYSPSYRELGGHRTFEEIQSIHAVEKQIAKECETYPPSAIELNYERWKL